MSKCRSVLLFLFLLIISTFSINSVNADTNKIDVTDISVKEKSGTITVVNPVFVSNEIRSNITFNQKDDFVTFELTLKNNSDEKYKVVSLEDNNTNNNITLEYTHDDNYISKDETTKVTIKIKYTNQLVNVDTISLNNLTIKINLVSEDGGSSDIIINPVTGDHLIHYLVLLIISLTGLVFAITKKKFKGFKVGSILLVLGLVMAPFVVFAYETYDVSIKFTDIDIKGKFETYNITIDSKDGSEPIVKQITYGNKLGDLPSDPSKEGYTFSKWVDQNGNTVTSETIIKGPIEVSAKYDAIDYEISYDLKGGSLPQGKTNPTSYNIESNNITLKNPEKTGYTFTGWTGTGLDGITPNVTIPTGSMGARSYTANYSASTSTAYKVIHKYQNYDLTTYTDFVQNLTGTTDEPITPDFRPQTGFNNPESKTTTTIAADGSTEVVYIYSRTSFSFEITDRTYIDEAVTTQNDNYLYETPIRVKALERAGYDFEWSDGDSNYDRTFDLTESISLTPVYTAKTNTPYIVNHYKAKLTSGYELADTQELAGTTDTPITPANNEYTGFIKPGTQTTTINGDGSTVVDYYYEREEYAFTIADRTYIDETVSTPNDNYPYETQVTLKALDREGYTFKWSDNNTDNPRTITITNNVSLTPVYTANTNTPYIVKHYKAKLTGGYELAYTDELTGTTDASITPARKEYTGFIKPASITTTIKGNGSTVVEYYYERTSILFEITDRTYIDETVTAPNDSYPYETSIRIKALERAGYNFEWSDGDTNYDRTFDLTEATSLTPEYAAKTNTPYIVKHYKANLNEGYTLADTDELTGTTDAPITPERKEYTGFIKPAAITTTIKGDGSTVVEYYYGRVSFSLTVNDSEYIQEGDLSDNYPYETQVTLTAIDRTHYTFTKWSNNETNNPITLTITEDITIAPVYTKNQYTITYNANGGTIEGSNITVIDGGDSLGSLPTVTPPTGKVLEGWYNESDIKIDENYVPTKTEQITARYENPAATSYTVSFNTYGGTSVSDIVVPIGDSISALPTTAKENNIFLGWFESTTSDTPVTVPYTPTSDITLIAKWDKMICKKATSLHTETCNSVSNKGCLANGYSVGDTITYGNIVSSDTFTSGDALDCDVDGTGYNQRFYYLRTNEDKAVLISNKNHINYTPEEGLDPQDENGIYSWAFDQLPTTSEWSELPILFDGRPTRLITVPDLFAMTGTSSPSDLSDNWSLGNYEFLFENSNYSGVHERSTQWVEEYNSKRYRYRNDSGNLVAVESGKENTSKNPVRPVIEVPLRLIEDAYIVRFDSNEGETPTQYAYVKKGSSIGTLPTATKTGKEFGGWYTSLEFTTKINENTVPNSYATYYAKWLDNVTNAALEYDSFILEIGEEDDIVITNLSDIEPVIFESTDEDIVTVDENGHLVGVGDGHTLVTITGTLSGAFITVDVTVSEEITDFTVTFDSMGGTDVDSMTVPKNTALGSLPSPDPTKADNDFAGWFTNTDYNVPVTVDTIIKSNVIFYAKWIPSDAVAEIDGNYYSTLQAAIDDAPTTKTTIKLIKNVAVTSPIDMVNKNTTKDIVLDLNGYTLSTASGAANKTNVIKTKTKLEVKNGTISSAKNDALIDVEGSNSYLVLRENIELISTGGRACVYNTGGNVLIEGNVTLTSNAEWTSSMKRGTVQTLTNGTTVIKGGTIINNRASSSYAVAIELGTVTIGAKDGLYDTENLIIQGETSGIYAIVNFSLYDGLVKGKTSAVNDESKIIDTEDNMDKVDDEVDGYKRLYYQGNPSTFIITLNSNGGTGAPDFISVDEGDSVSESDITEPTKGVYTFDGWYYDAELQNPVTFPFTPSANMPLYAGWSYTPDPMPVSFNMTNDVMTNYFNNINTWKTQYEVTGTKAAKDLPDGSSYNEVVDSSEFEATMKANFDAYNCSACGTSASQNSCSSPLAGDYCERPKGYNTGLSENINVYEYDTTNDTSTLVTYTTSTNGIIYNMIPGKTYKWESTSDNNIYGFVEVSAVSGRRTIYSNVRNVRDLGGMEVSFTRGNTTKTGTIKYGKLYRGAQLTGGQSDVNSLTKLGITREVDLRSDDEQSPSPVRLTKYDKCDVNCSPLNSSDDIIIKNYIIYPEKYSDNYANLRDAMKYVMQSVVDGDNIYFHCTIGTDRTGTIAYFLEGLLGVSEEDRIEDYELTYFYGLLNRTRFHDELSGSSIKPRFLSMNKTYDTNEKIYNFYMYGLTDEQIAEENVLIEQFRDAMIDYNN